MPALITSDAIAPFAYFVINPLGIRVNNVLSASALVLASVPPYATPIGLRPL